MEQENIRNVGIVAHVDAGKTTTTEYMLYDAGLLREPGSVDRGTTQTDSLEIERRRGISVRAAATVIPWKNARINLIDTPGHVDFSAEVERALQVLDGAVLIVSAVEGVQAHTETLWRALAARRLPTLIFVNKLDRVGADPGRVLQAIRKTLGARVAPLQACLGVEKEFAGAVPVLRFGNEETSNAAQSDMDPEREQSREALLDALAEVDEQVLERYVNGEELDDAWIASRLRAAVHAGEICPVLFGCAQQGIGVRELLDAIVEWLPPPGGNADAPVGGVVFKLERDRAMGRLAYVRLYQGTLANRDAVMNASSDTVDKVTQIRQTRALSQEDVGVLRAGDIAAVCGLGRVKVGDVLGDPSVVPPLTNIAVPLLSVQVIPEKESTRMALAEALQELTEEDPLLGFTWRPDDRELHIQVMGVIQLEILASLLASRFGFQVTFGDPIILYKETPERVAEGFVAYTMPKPCWAILRFRIEPGPRGSGIQYAAFVRTEDLLLQYQNEVARRVPEALQQGLYGWEVTDLKVTLIEGQHHVWHTHPLDFVVATPMAIMDGLTNTGTRLLEPILRYRITVPTELESRVLGDLTQMRATFDTPVVAGDRSIIEGDIPVATSLQYPVALASLSGGRATLVTRFLEYRDCPPGTVVSRPRRGIDPRDHAKWILAARSAL